MIGIRHEDKSKWEGRTPLVPQDVAGLIREHGLQFQVQTSPTRAFVDAAFAEAGAVIVDELSDCPIVLGVKEIPPEKLLPERTYVYFSHTIKGQPANMPALRRLMELKCQLIDYEKIADEHGRRLVFFGRYAGLAGMIDSLWALGQRWEHEGLQTPLKVIQQAHKYESLQAAEGAIKKAGEQIRQDGLPDACQPFVCGFAGYGQVSQGAQEIYDLLPVEEIAPGDLPGCSRSANTCYKVVFHEKHMVERIDPSKPFDLQEYYDLPERYRGQFPQYLPYLTVLMVGIYWEPKYPRLVTCDLLREMYTGREQPRLRVIGDISCDVEGSVECTLRVTDSDNPVYVYEPTTGQARDGVAGDGPVILAVDHLPCELPIDSSVYFSQSLRPFIPGLCRADFAASLADCGLPPELMRATILYHGVLTEPFRYMEEFLET